MFRKAQFIKHKRERSQIRNRDEDIALQNNVKEKHQEEQLILQTTEISSMQ